MNRIKGGWQLTKKSWSVLRSDRSLALFPLLSLVFIAIAMVIIWGGALIADPNTLSEDGSSVSPAAYVIGAISAYLATAIAIFFNVALASCADRALRGEQTSVGDGIRAARARLPQILAWALLAITVQLILRAVAERFQLVGQIIAGILGAVWGVATYLVVPVLALEGPGPLAALKRSGQAIRARWGEGLTGFVTIGVVHAVNLIVALVFFGVLVFAAWSAGLGGFVVALVIFALLTLIAISVVFSALEQIFRVSLYRYAVEGQSTGVFDAADMESAFRHKRGKDAGEI